MVGGGGDGGEVRFCGGVDEEDARGGRGIDLGADGGGALAHGVEVYEAEGERGLVAEPTEEVGIGHGVQGVAGEAGFVEGDAVDEEVAEVLGAAVDGEGGDGDGAGGGEEGEEFFEDGADVAGGGGIEGGAVFEEELARVECGEHGVSRASDGAGFGGGNAAGLAAGDDGLGLEGGEQATVAQTEDERAGDALGGDHAGEVGAAGEIVSDGGELEW